MPDRHRRASDSTESLQWRGEFSEAFRPLFHDLETIPPGDWTWRLDYSHLLSVVMYSKTAGRLVSVNLPNDWRKMLPADAARITAATVRERMLEPD